MKLYFLFWLLFGLTMQSQAQTYIQPFVHYFDCMRSTRSPLVDLDVFMKIQGAPSSTHRFASDYTRGLDFDLEVGPTGEIQGVRLSGQKQSLTTAQLKAGVQFGVFQKTFHTIELASDFSPQKGGHLIMGTLTSISTLGMMRAALLPSTHSEKDADLRQAQKKFPSAGLSEKLARQYNSGLSPEHPLWVQETFQIVRQNNEWVLLNSRGHRVDTIFVEMKIPKPNVPMVLGLTQINSVFMNKNQTCLLVKPEEKWRREAEVSTVQFHAISGSSQTGIECNRQ